MPPWRWELRLVSWGRDGTMEAVPPATIEVEENLIEYRRSDLVSGPGLVSGSGLVEWYRNDEEGLQQGFTLLSPPG